MSSSGNVTSYLHSLPVLYLYLFYESLYEWQIRNGKDSMAEFELGTSQLYTTGHFYLSFGLVVLLLLLSLLSKEF